MAVPPERTNFVRHGPWGTEEEIWDAMQRENMRSIDGRKPVGVEVMNGRKMRLLFERPNRDPYEWVGDVPFYVA